MDKYLRWTDRSVSVAAARSLTSEPDLRDAGQVGQSRPARDSEEKDEVDADESDDAETGRLLQEAEEYEADTVRVKAGTRSEEDAAEMVRRVSFHKRQRRKEEISIGPDSEARVDRSFQKRTTLHYRR